MYVGYQRQVVDGNVRTVADLNVPANATHVEIQADTQNARYRMDNGVPGQNLGMLFIANADPKTFVIDDLLRIQWFQAQVANGWLNFHYFAGRDV